MCQWSSYSGSCRVERVFFNVRPPGVLDHAVNLDDGDAAVVGVGVVAAAEEEADVAANARRDSFGRRGLRGADGGLVATSAATVDLSTFLGNATERSNACGRSGKRRRAR